ncbi:hypothetical protein E2C01_008731 [Portunus trituberculatus]|uniref:Uncharacterized protein n=1 Tax=Portunus trituberculatus TaxID=210409 RepID=A0A5B7D1K6_PORTR|nr:hypothetical protein [Portunus trituberculatus]
MTAFPVATLQLGTALDHNTQEVPEDRVANVLWAMRRFAKCTGHERMMDSPVTHPRKVSRYTDKVRALWRGSSPQQVCEAPSQPTLTPTANPHHPDINCPQQHPFPTHCGTRPGTAARGGDTTHIPPGWVVAATGGAAVSWGTRSTGGAPRGRQDREAKHRGWLPRPVTATPAQPPALRRPPPAAWLAALRCPPPTQPTAADFSASETCSVGQRHGHGLTIQLTGCE